ncbi:hypothetical protein D3C76_1605010 [compost metagenome]
MSKGSSDERVAMASNGSTSAGPTISMQFMIIGFIDQTGIISDIEVERVSAFNRE